MNIELTDREVEYLIRALVLNYADRQEDFHPPDDITTRNGLGDSLISKLVRLSGKAYDAYVAVKNERYSAKEPVSEKLFLGAGYHSILQKNQLHKRLEFAFSELGGIQQNGGQGTEFDKKMDKECSENIHSVLADIVYAFGYDVPCDGLERLESDA